MKTLPTLLFSALFLPAAALAQELPSSGASDEGLGKNNVIGLSSALSSHSAVRRVRFDDHMSVSAVRWGPGEGTVWVYRDNEIGTKTGFQHFAVRVYMKQDGPGQVAFKTAAFCDVGSDRFRNITADRCERLKQEIMPKLVAANEQDFITFIGGDNTTPNQAKAAAEAIHGTISSMIGGGSASSASHGSRKVQGDID